MGRAVYLDGKENGIKVSVRVPNGKTIVIGGLLRRKADDTTTKVPFLGDVPFLGAAFRHHAKTSGDRELMVFLTPHVIDTDGQVVVAAGNYNARAMAAREQSFPDSRQGLIDREMDSVTQFRQQ